MHNNLTIENLDNETWVDVLDYDGIYNVSNLGRVKSLERFVSNGRGGERIVKERILKQSTNLNHCTVSLCVNNISIKKQVSDIVYFSFNKNKIRYLHQTEIAHLNKIFTDNKLTNLKLMDISRSKKISSDLGLIDNFIKINKNRKLIYNELKDRKCVKCNELKDINKFKRGYHTCMICEYHNRLRKQGKTPRIKTIIEIIDTVTGVKTTHNNKKKCVCSPKIINRFANTGIEVKPYKNSKHKNNILIFINKA